jgi:hypothetical protein
MQTNRNKTVALALLLALAAPGAVRAEGAEYLRTTGKVEELTSRAGVETIGLVDQDGELTRFQVTPDTVFIDREAILTGAAVTGFYAAGTPAVAIYPPQHPAAVIAAEKAGRSVKVDVFDENLLSGDGTLQLNLSDATEIVGAEAGAPLGNRHLAVLYGVATHSLPAQTTPDKIILLRSQGQAPNPATAEPSPPETSEAANPPAQPTDPHSIAVAPAEPHTIVLEPAAPFVGDGDVTMVPLRAVAEGFGLAVEWDDSRKEIRLDNGYTFYVNSGKCYYYDQELHMPAPITLREGRAYVAAPFVRARSGYEVEIGGQRITLRAVEAPAA